MAANGSLAALEREEAAARAREEQRQAQRANMTLAQRQEERFLIEQHIAQCRSMQSIDNEPERSELIERGYVPIIDVQTLDRGIAIEDLIRIHNQCRSRRALIIYLNGERDRTQPPNIGTGHPLTRADMAALGLNANEYRFFNIALPRANPAAPLGPADLAAIGQQHLLVANAEGRNPVDGLFVSITVGQDHYLGRLLDWLLPYNDFVTLLETPFAYHPLNEMRSYTVKFSADDSSLIWNMVMDYQNNSAFLAHDVLGNAERARTYTLLLRKIDYLLNQWRSKRDLPYNPFIRNNSVLRSLLRRHDPEIVLRLFRHARRLHLFFAAHDQQFAAHPERRLGNLLQAFVTETENNPTANAVTRASLRTFARPYIMNDQMWLNERLNRNFTRVYALFHEWTNDLTQFLAHASLEEFQRYIRPHSPRLVFRALYPNLTEGFFVAPYRPEQADLINLIADDPVKIDHLIREFRTDAPGFNAAFDVSANDFRTLRVLFNRPASLQVLLQANAENENRGETFIRLRYLHPDQKLELYNASGNAAARQLLVQYWANDEDDDDNDDDDDN